MHVQKTDPAVEKLVLSMVATYKSLRHLLVAVAIIFLVSLLAYHFTKGDGIQRNSISAYYHSQEKLLGHIPIRDLFVATFVSVAMMLFAYKGFTWKESWVLNIAAIGLLVVALCPMEWNQPAVVADDVTLALQQSNERAQIIVESDIASNNDAKTAQLKADTQQLQDGIQEKADKAKAIAQGLHAIDADLKNSLPQTLRGWLHYAGALTFFFGIACVCWFHADDTLKELFKTDPTRQKVYSSLYLLTGTLMGLVPVLAVGLYWYGLRSTVLLVELAGVLVFMLYWTIKSLELSNVEIQGTAIKGV
ncbi:MAG TPA: hypothetical protein VHR66_07830 [Gemmataceae bacterium]|jgi:hypothetical protein|nr:hypothetical protein [Gemmataceae bacterium]